ncbi:MAG TPA: hypothetical protein VEU30_12465, partial [Thermoanaerobaculia bacterium]|nr:hypothetical protein [Thermoanaerobaculia bacterium]
IVRPYFSEHAAHLFKFKLFGGHYGEMADAVPGRPVLWREGETLAYLIDFMSDDGQTIDLRVDYNDSAPSSPYGLPDAKTMTRKVDVAIFCVASHAQQADYPRKYLEVMQPRHLLLGHWESFFGSFDKAVMPVRGTNVTTFLDAVKEYSFTLPDRHTVVTVKY